MFYSEFGFDKQKNKKIVDIYIAKKEYDTALKYAYIYNILSAIYLEKKDYKKSLEYSKRILERQLYMFLANYNAVKALLMLHRNQEAAEYFEAMLKYELDNKKEIVSVLNHISNAR